MCQIFCAQGVTFSLDRLAVSDLYSSNPDGIGFVDFHNPNVAVKILPQNEQEAWEFIRDQVNGKQGAVHFRWRTDGAVDTERVHPYPAGERFWLIHNGVLGNYRTDGHTKKKQTPLLGEPWPKGTTLPKDVGPNGHVVQSVAQIDPRSDTQRIAEETLGPMLDKFGPELMLNAQFQKMLSNYIGSNNRFVIVDRQTGEHCIINEHTGYHPEDGVWQANSYAGDYRWTPPKFSYKGGYNGHVYNGYGGFGNSKGHTGWSGTDDSWGMDGGISYDDALSGPSRLEPSDLMPSRLVTISDVVEWFEAMGFCKADAPGMAKHSKLTDIGRRNLLTAALNVLKLHQPTLFSACLDDLDLAVADYLESFETPQDPMDSDLTNDELAEAAGASGTSQAWAHEELMGTLETTLDVAWDAWEEMGKKRAAANQAKSDASGKQSNRKRRKSQQQPKLESVKS